MLSFAMSVLKGAKSEMEQRVARQGHFLRSGFESLSHFNISKMLSHRTLSWVFVVRSLFVCLFVHCKTVFFAFFLA